MAYDVFGLGNTLMDLMYQVEDEDIEELKLKKGTMQLADDETAAAIRSRYDDPKMVPAGGTTNTLLGISALGGRCVLCGMVGNGKFGQFYEEVIDANGITSRLVKSADARTGTVHNLVTPDAERTFAVNLGASLKLGKDSIIEKDIHDSRYLYFTGYEFESVNETAMHCVDVAKKGKIPVAFDLADPELVKRNRQKFKDLLPNLSILFLNELEADAFVGLAPEPAAIVLGKKVPIVVVKNGPSGSFISDNGRIIRIEAVEAKAVDTTGAGDLFAAGFLYGMVQGKPIEESGNIGSIMGAKIVEQVGALLDEKAKAEIRLLK